MDLIYSYKWLKELVGTDLSARELAVEITKYGPSIDKVHSHGDDFVYEVEVTTNRPDSMSALGLAREFSAILGKKFNFPIEKFINNSTNAIDIAITSPKCVEFNLVKMSISKTKLPELLEYRLKASNIHTVSPVVDLTNYIAIEVGNPVHAYDAAKVVGKIEVRQAKKGERFID